jgi:hypothetical protein
LFTFSGVGYVQIARVRPNHDRFYSLRIRNCRSAGIYTSADTSAARCYPRIVPLRFRGKLLRRAAWRQRRAGVPQTQRSETVGTLQDRSERRCPKNCPGSECAVGTVSGEHPIVGGSASNASNGSSAVARRAAENGPAGLHIGRLHGALLMDCTEQP